MRSPDFPCKQIQSDFDLKNLQCELEESKIQKNYQTLQLEDINESIFSNLKTQKDDTSNFKSNWIDSTTGVNNCFLSGKGSTYGTKSHISVHNAMDQVIHRQHKAAQKQYMKMISLRGPKSSTNQKYMNSKQSSRLSHGITNLGSSQLIHNESISYQDLSNSRKMSIQHKVAIHPNIKADHSHIISNNNNQYKETIQYNDKPSLTITTIADKQQQQKEPIFLNTQNNAENEEDDHFKEVFDTIGTLVQGLNRKQSFGGTSNISMISTSKRTTNQYPFSLSRSNSRRTKDVLKVQIANQIQQDQMFKAKNAPKISTPKFFALKSTKLLTIPQEVHLKTEQRELSKQREQTHSTKRKTLGDRIQSVRNLQTYGQKNQINEGTLDNPLINIQQKNYQGNGNVEAQDKNIEQPHIRNFSGNQFKNTQRIHQIASVSTAEANTNKFMEFNIKKMKIGHNYAQLVNYAKSKFVQ